MYQIQKIPGRTVLIDNQEFLWFGGTSYLGLGHNEAFQKLIQMGLNKYGSNWGSSRNNPIKIDIYEHLEIFLTDFTKAPSAISVSSGLLAGQIALKYIESSSPNSTIIYAPRVHPALWASDFKPTNISYETFIQNINNQILSINNADITLVADAVSSPHIENYTFDWVIDLPKSKTINLIIDDSHSLGICGKNGGGIFNQIRHNNNVNLIVVSSLNKALGVPGGVIFCHQNTAEKIRKLPFYTASSPMSPTFAYVCAFSKNIYFNSLKKLNENIVIFNSLISVLTDLQQLDNYPSYCFQKEGLTEYLLEHKVIIPSFAYPLPTDSKITRLVISSLHTETDLKFLADLLIEFYK